MLSYDSCPEKLPCMPDWPTIGGEPFEVSVSLSQAIALANELAEYSRRQIKIESDPEFAASEKEKDRSHSIGFALPVLSTIGLTEALKEVERVLAWNQTEKHPGAKWKSKSIDWHDSKAVSHLSKAQNESLKDNETGCSHRAHACCRLLMSLAHELETAKHYTDKQSPE